MEGDLEFFGGSSSTNPSFTSITGTRVAEVLDETNLSGTTLTLQVAPIAVRILNEDTTNSGTFTVNGLPLVVPAGASLETGVEGTPSITVTVSGSTSFQFQRLV